MASLKVITYNVRGLCSPCKHSKLWWELKRLGAQVVFLQETHCTPQSMPKLPTHLYSQWFLSNLRIAKSRGTGIVIHKSCPFQVTGTKVDPQGSYVYLKGTLSGQKLTLATIFAPNSSQLAFIDSTLETLVEFREGSLILRGDFKVSTDPLLDTLHRRPSHSNAFLKRFRRSLQNHRLIDSWRVLHPSDRDYSYYSKVHDVYTGIDFICIDHLTLELLQASTIANLTISDHAPVTATLALQPGTRRTWSWRLNESLLDDMGVVSGVTNVLTHYFRENNTEGMSKGIIWEGQKAVVRGELISWGSRLKKARQVDFHRVLQALHKAELEHKQNGNPEALRRLTEMRELFACLLDHQARKQLRYMLHKYYEQGNKCDRMLARALWRKRVLMHVHKLHLPSNELSVRSSQIASGLRDYYATLYNLNQTQPPNAQAAKLAAIREYMSTSGLPLLTDEQCSTLESPITPTEIEATVKSLPNGRSPGPDGLPKLTTNYSYPCYQRRC